MRLILVGCEYVGTTKLANAIDDWMASSMGVRFSLIHDHWKIPHTSGHPDDSTPEEQAWLLKATPKFKEMHKMQKCKMQNQKCKNVKCKTKCKYKNVECKTHAKFKM